MAKLRVETEGDADLVFALKTVKAMMKTGKIKAKQFDMGNFESNVYDKHNHVCGTSHCIGGWASAVLGQPAWQQPDLPLSDAVASAAHNLYFPVKDANYNSKKKHAIQAIDNFLKGHKNPWRKVEL